MREVVTSRSCPVCVESACALRVPWPATGCLTVPMFETFRPTADGPEGGGPTCVNHIAPCSGALWARQAAAILQPDGVLRLPTHAYASKSQSGVRCAVFTSKQEPLRHTEPNSAHGPSAQAPPGLTANLVRPRYDAPATTGLSPTRSGRNNPSRIRASASNAPAITVQPPLLKPPPPPYSATLRKTRPHHSTRLAHSEFAVTREQGANELNEPNEPNEPNEKNERNENNKTQRARRHQRQSSSLHVSQAAPQARATSRDFSVDQGKSGHLRDRPGQGAEDEQYGNGAEGGRAVEGGGGCAESA